MGYEQRRFNSKIWLFGGNLSGQKRALGWFLDEVEVAMEIDRLIHIIRGDRSNIYRTNYLP